MVDINLIGDDKTGEQERVEEFTQTSSMDTQELAFEERTETFDTTKTAGFAQRRSYSSLVSTIIIFFVIVLLSGTIYFFMFRGDDEQSQAEIPVFTPEPSEEAGGLNAPQEQQPATSDDDAFALDQPEPSQPAAQPTPTPQESEPEARQPAPQRPATTRQQPPATTRPATTRTARLAVNAQAAVQTVSTILGTVPSGVSTTLLSYSGDRVRLEVVSGSAEDGRALAARLNQSFGANSFSIVSESRTANGAALEKVLLKGSVSSGGEGSNNVEVLDAAGFRSWTNSRASQYGLSVREFSVQQAVFVGGNQNTPVLIRLVGSQASLLGFLDDMATRGLNVQVNKVLMVSPDMANFTDDTMVLLLSVFLASA